MREGIDYQIDVAADGRRLWITGADGSCIARFDKRFGLDVHRSAADQVAGLGECLYCTHEPADARAWARFRQEVERHHRITVPKDAIQYP